MNINEQNIIDLIARIESDAAGGIAADPQDAERLAATATDQLDGMLLLLGTTGVEVGGKSAWERTVAEIQSAQDRLRIASIAALESAIPRPTTSRHANGAGILR